MSPSRELKVFVLLLYGTLRYQQNILLLFRHVTECLSHSCFNTRKGNNNTHSAVHSDSTVIAAVIHFYWFTSYNDSSDQPVSKVSLSTDQCQFLRPLQRHVYSPVTEAKQDRCRFSIRYWMEDVDCLIKLDANFDIATRFPYPIEINPSAAVQPTNPVCSLDNSTISGTVWWADGRPLLSVVLWLWLSAVLHYSWTVIRLIALHWKEGWTKPPPEPTYSREGVKCCD